MPVNPGIDWQPVQGVPILSSDPEQGERWRVMPASDADLLCCINLTLQN